jgi:hypothetical protein
VDCGACSGVGLSVGSVDRAGDSSGLALSDSAGAAVVEDGDSAGGAGTSNFEVSHGGL